ncbi:MAG: hypothetical protein LBC20_18760, partial [Planctomycetaceae bacterium]|nr:hypothetical protein [Planctomycetaceae bacterium]
KKIQTNFRKESGKMHLYKFVIYQWNIRQFVYQWTPKSAYSPTCPCLTDGNEKTTNRGDLSVAYL